MTPTETSVSMRGLAVAEVQCHAAVERPGAPRGDRRGEREREPLPVAELQRRDHRQQQHRQRRARRATTQQAVAAATIARPVDAASAVGVGDVGAVADRLDGRDEVVGATARPRSNCDARLLGRVVHRGRHAVEPVELPLDARRTGGAGHAGDVEVDRAQRRVRRRDVSRRRRSRLRRSPPRWRHDRGRRRDR